MSKIDPPSTADATESPHAPGGLESLGERLTAIPFNRPVLSGKEVDYVLDAIRRMHISGDGYYTKACQAFLEQEICVPKVLLTTSCTHALEMCALLLEIRPGDEVIVSSFTFTSTINAFVLRGAIPRFIDISPDTLNIDPRLVERAITQRTRAIVVMHYAGVACEMDSILAIAKAHQVSIVEDNAHGLLGRYKGKPLGSFGALATQSFHETKNFTCGEGGALLLNDTSLVDRAEIIREKGTDRSKFFRGQVDKYSWVDLGSSYLPSDVLAAYLLAQFEVKDRIQEVRRTAWQTYSTALREWATDHGVRLPFVPQHCEQAYHMFYLLMPSSQERDAFIAYMKRRRISCVFHYLPLHLSNMGRSFGGAIGDCPVTEDISDRLVRLPMYNNIGAAELNEVISVAKDFSDWTTEHAHGHPA
jgi:dTDP-4-amino-4,6-dideoxygalactose transaminase